MASAWGETAVLLRIALRNLLASRARTVIVGGIILLGTILAVVGSSLLDSMDRGIRASIQGSLGGHLQLYAARSKDELALYGGGGESELDPIEDFSRVKAVMEKVPNVRMVVPMGIAVGLIPSGNPLDALLEKMRGDARRLGAGERDPALLRQWEARKAHARRLTTLLHEALAKARAIGDESLLKERAQSWDDVGRAASDGFWAHFDDDRLGSLEFMENRIAPLSAGAGSTFVRYVGTDLDAFMKAFDRAEVVEGTAVPKSQRGVLLGKWYAEEHLKLKTARRLDEIKDARDLRRRRIANDAELQGWVKENATQTREILLQLDPVQAREAAARLQRALGTDEPDLEKLLVQLLTVDDADFDRHYRTFYDELVPLLQLYLVRPGDMITIQAPSRTGHVNSVNVKVYGYVQFRGLERSSIAGVMSLLDLMTFRDLYGYLTPQRAEEIRRIKESVGERPVGREKAEEDLFGRGRALERQTRATSIDPARLLGAVGPREKGDPRRVYTQEEIDRGVALNAALILGDPGRLRATARDVEAAARAAGLDLKVVDWQKASGAVGQFVTLARAILYTAVFIIFAAALVIISNALVLATLQRVREIGTLRAIGAQRRFVLLMLLVEAVTTGLVFGALGVLLGAGIVELIRAGGGIPATNNELYFFFSGPALLPTVGAASLVACSTIVFLVSLLAGFYPALIAMRITPVEAMAAEG